MESSGCNQNNFRTFIHRLYEKNSKFTKNKYGIKADEELIGVVDFFHRKYLIWVIP